VNRVTGFHNLQEKGTKAGPVTGHACVGLVFHAVRMT
jgi:hypothetical protein